MVSNARTGWADVYFKSMYGWDSPSLNHVLLSQGTITVTNAVYQRDYARLTVNVFPSSIATNGASWRLDGGPWQECGLQTNLVYGSYTLEFKDVPGWRTPADQYVSLYPGQSKSANGYYYDEVLSSLYVSLHGGHTSPYTNWSTAATNIQAAVDMADAGSLILVSNGTHNLDTAVDVSKDVVLRGFDGAASTRIDGGNKTRCLYVNHANAVIEELTLTNGWATHGGGVYIASAGGTVRDSRITGCTAGNYGGGAFLNGSGTIEDCTIHANTAVTNDGGGVYLSQGGEVRRCVISSNEAAKAGGAFVYSGGAIRNSLIRRNHARGPSDGRGGGVLLFMPGGVLENCTVVENTAQALGDGINAVSGGAIRNCIVYSNNGNNHCNNGGTWSDCCTTPSIGSGCIIDAPGFLDSGSQDYRLAPNSPCIDEGTTQAWMAAATDLQGYPRIVDSSVDIGAYEHSPVHYVSPAGSNVWPFVSWADAANAIEAAVAAAHDGDAVRVAAGTYYPNGEITVTQSLVITATDGAAATVVDGHDDCRCFALNANATLDGFTIAHGWTDYVGGGVLCGATGTVIRNCIFEDNVCDNYGGGIFFGAEGGLMENCIVRRNTAVAKQAGGVYARKEVTIRNCLIYTNTANEGGGLFLYRGGLAENCTIVSNAADWLTGGVRCYHGGTVSNSILYFNHGEPGPNISFLQGGTIHHSCVEPVPPGTGNLDNPPAFLGDDDFRLQPDSPCIDVGLNAAWTGTSLDLEGNPRCVGPTVDLGAYECTPIHYVSKLGSNVWPFASWTDASTDIADAVAAAAERDTVLVEAGTYPTPGEISLSGNRTLKSLSGPNTTLIDAQEHHRAITVTGGLLEGFTIAHGLASEGGGICCNGQGTVRSCTVVSNQAASHGGGVLLFGGTLDRCTLTQNEAGSAGGGLFLAEGGLATCCLVSSNTASERGGGVYIEREGALRGCVIHDNGAENGGGVYADFGTLEDCTIACNGADTGGGIICVKASVINSVIGFNEATHEPDFLSEDGLWEYCCLDPAIGANCIEEDPEFLDLDKRNCRLSPRSPCIDRGDRTLLTCDPDGTPCPLDGDNNGDPRPDIGAYEFLHAGADSDGDDMLDGWELRYGLNPIDPADGSEDWDADGVPNDDESIADTNPTNALSYFCILALDATNSCTVWFNCSTARVYSLQTSRSLTTGTWTSVSGATGKPGESPGSMSLTDTNDSSGGYYRVRAERP